ncbi:DUF6069 family protein [Actinomadura rudentiformis]|uniref:Uncharacterized protein n=1 Tax=Actinomadura rudentiformis TaxID=359158 RepID=A0A6H9YQ85_9ACTN|nr:DUF6069 family protein [Actinomadura rudentiformis]KAB2343024.1 hypothetical protein F8566_36335 [Actinomadura rudentiformis]
MVTETRRGTGARLRARFITVVATVLATVAVWAVAALAFGQDDLVVQQPGREAMELGAGQMVFFSFVPALLGWAFLAVLERFVPAQARVVWTVVASGILVLSFVPVLQVEATDGTKVTLALLHLVVGAVLIPGFWRTGGRPE